MSAWNSFDRSTRTLRRSLLAALACAGFTPLLSGQSASIAPAPQPLAMLDGQTITEAMLPSGEQVQLQRMQVQVYGVEMRALHAVVDQKLLNDEAKRRGISVENLLRTEVDAKVAEPSDSQVSAYYQASHAAMTQPLGQIKDKIREGMRNVEIQKARTIYIQGLWQQAVSGGQLALLLTPPILNLPVDPARVRGDAKAPVTIVEFSDFTCPFCRLAEPTVNQILAKYPGKVKLAYRDFPLRDLHPRAELAAEASRCAGAQGKYWEYHDVLFASQTQGIDDLIQDARSLHLDAGAFQACLSSGQFKPAVDQDVQLGNRGGVMGTPGFFVNGVFMSGAQPLEEFEKIINAQLAASDRNQAEKKASDTQSSATAAPSQPEPPSS